MNFQNLILIKPRTTCTPTKSTVAFFSLSYPTVCTEAQRFGHGFIECQYLQFNFSTYNDKRRFKLTYCLIHVHVGGIYKPVKKVW